ncbi:LapA family protein [Roseicitreum antarcticum]|uniref:Lipopolysaccharide assembly protein A domain-containing protein n=1 Tax=Roseicitreum antarcticum TaxID=564137 RepID=A0A1H2VS30_9RHOB|nr:LapA family protein [Roseicitreum antarcticum]SDW71120.1 hypothetical protein SAMN04488238_103157 [Roseicitreum antarcticum]
MKYIRYAFWTLLALAFVIVALANRNVVTVSLLPQGLGDLIGFNISLTMPLFLILGGAIATGLLLGLVWEWLRERGYRKDATAARAEADNLKTQITRERASGVPVVQRDDDVLALVDGPNVSR